MKPSVDSNASCRCGCAWRFTLAILMSLSLNRLNWAKEELETKWRVDGDKTWWVRHIPETPGLRRWRGNSEGHTSGGSRELCKFSLNVKPDQLTHCIWAKAEAGSHLLLTASLFSMSGIAQLHGWCHNGWAWRCEGFSFSQANRNHPFISSLFFSKIVENFWWRSFEFDVTCFHASLWSYTLNKKKEREKKNPLVSSRLESGGVIQR